MLSQNLEKEVSSNKKHPSHFSKCEVSATFARLWPFFWPLWQKLLCHFFHTVKEETKKQDFWAENKTLLKVELNPSIRIVTTLVGH